jgi:hypothetical protein
MNTDLPKYANDQSVYDRIENNFQYHKPIGSQPERYVALRDGAKELAYLLVGYCPESRERSLALTNLEDAIMWANAGIARNEKEKEGE